MNIDKAIKIKGFMSELELQWLASMAESFKCIVEIGTYYGRSARAMADNSSASIYCIDPYPGPIMNIFNKIAIASGEFVYKQAKENLGDHINNGKVIIHRGTVGDFPYHITPDFVFIDGDHLEEQFKKDLEWSENIMRGGILAGHDYGNVDWPAVKQLVDEKYSTIGRIGLIWYVNKK